MQRLSHAMTFAVMLTVVTLLAALPQMAFAQDAASQLKTQGNSALGWLWTAVYFILIVAVMGSGVMAAFGRLAWATVGQVLIGAIVAGLAVAIVQALFGSSTNTSFG